MRVVKTILSVGLMLSALNVAADDVEARLTKSLQRVFPDIEISQINPTPIKDVYEVMIGPDVVYMTDDARYVLKGDLIDMQERRNLSEDVRAQSRIDLLKAVPASDYIEFASKKGKETVYVFTDVDCGYCRKLHKDISELNDNGITVRYLAYPRAGIGSSAYKEMENIWCAKDRNQALTDAKNGKPAESSSCKNPVATQYSLGKDVGVRGTPAIFLNNGRAIPGYMPPDELLRVLADK